MSRLETHVGFFRLLMKGIYDPYVLKPGQKKKGQNCFQLHHFLNTFLQLAAEKKYSKNDAAGNFFGPSYFVTALSPLNKKLIF